MRCTGDVEATFAGVVTRIVQLTKDPRSEAAPKLRLQCITALGYLAYGCRDAAFMGVLVKSLLAMTPSGTPACPGSTSISRVHGVPLGSVKCLRTKY